ALANKCQELQLLGLAHTYSLRSPHGFLVTHAIPPFGVLTVVGFATSCDGARGYNGLNEGEPSEAAPPICPEADNSNWIPLAGHEGNARLSPRMNGPMSAAPDGSVRHGRVRARHGRAGASGRKPLSQ